MTDSTLPHLPAAADVAPTDTFYMVKGDGSSDHSVTAAVLADAIGGGRVVEGAATLTLAGTLESVDFAVLLDTSPFHLLILQVLATTGGDPQNYHLFLYDGDPEVDGTQVYAATGITGASYSDTAPFFVPALVNGSLYAAAANVDSDPTAISLTVRMMRIAPT
jgi:hypothetical protein